MVGGPSQEEASSEAPYVFKSRMASRSRVLALTVMMCLFTTMALFPTWSCGEDIFADAVDYGKMHYRLDEDLNSSWNESPLYHESFRLFPACPAAVRSVLFSERTNSISDRRAAR